MIPVTKKRDEALAASYIDILLENQDSSLRRRARKAARDIEIVCVGDSITGWNEYGPPVLWPTPTYPDFLQQQVSEETTKVANCGFGGRLSAEGIPLVDRYLQVFENARYFVIGFGTNDLAGTDSVPTEKIIENIDAMVDLVLSASKEPILFNVPYINGSEVSRHMKRWSDDRRDFHNQKLGTYCSDKGVPLVDICSKLENEHLGDMLHPNENGAKIIAREIYPVVSQHVNLVLV